MAKNEIKLFKCPDCEKEISTSAVSCPHCGRKFNILERKANKLGKDPVEFKKKENRNFTIGCLTVVLLPFAVIFIVVLVGLVSGDEKNNASNKPKTISSTEAIITCGNYYKDIYKQKTGLKAKTHDVLGNNRVAENASSWLIQLDGEIQSAYGVWISLPAKCHINKIFKNELTFQNYDEITYFKFLK